MLTAIRSNSLRAVRRFLLCERGDATPMSYLLALLLCLTFIFFALDLGLRKGARLSTEYAAFCAARSAATYLPRGDEKGACINDEKTAAITRAAAACLAAVEPKGGLLWGKLGFELPLNSINQLVTRTAKHVQVEILDEDGHAQTCFTHNQIVTAKVTYTYRSFIPLSPLRWNGGAALQITATAQHMLHTVK